MTACNHKTSIRCHQTMALDNYHSSLRRCGDVANRPRQPARQEMIILYKKKKKKKTKIDFSLCFPLVYCSMREGSGKGQGFGNRISPVFFCSTRENSID